MHLKMIFQIDSFYFSLFPFFFLSICLIISIDMVGTRVSLSITNWETNKFLEYLTGKYGSQLRFYLTVVTHSFTENKSGGSKKCKV